MCCRSCTVPWPKPGKEDSHEQRPDSSEEHGGSDKHPRPQPEKGGKGHPFQNADGNNNNDGESIFVILSSRNCYCERDILNLIENGCCVGNKR
jgi:hypothetical protein